MMIALFVLSWPSWQNYLQMIYGSHLPLKTSQLDTLLLETMTIANFSARVNQRVYENDCIEVLHYLRKEKLTNKVWLFPQRGTGVFYKIGNLKVFQEHYEMNLFFSNATSCTLNNQCRFVSRKSIEKAVEQNYATVQFLAHSQDKDGVKKNELIDLRSAHNQDYSHLFGDDACLRPCIIRSHPSILRCKV
jgi:hypothetical protein